MTLAAALADAAARLAKVSDTPRLDAELLLAHALGVGRDRLLLDHVADAGMAVPVGFDALIARRLHHEPVAYLTGSRAFWTIELAVGPGVLVPRPDSETLIEAAVDHFGRAGPATVLDLGTGPGTLLLAALAQWPQARGVGIDRSQAALDYARRNAERLGLGAHAGFRIGDWDGTGDAFDLILCNPPYVGLDAALDPQVRDHEPAEALFAGPDGLDDYRRIAPLLRGQLAPGGIACIEIGAGQGDAVTALFAAEGLAVAVRADLGGRDRCLIVRN